MTRRLAPWATTSAAILVLVASIAASLTLGPVHVAIGDVASLVLHHLGLGPAPDISTIKAATVWELRLPRALLATLCGAGLAACGAVLQSLLRNPLADPYLLGISAGASTGAVVMLFLAPVAFAWGQAASALIGALVAFGAAVLLARASGGGNQRIILAGVAVTHLFSALTSFLIMATADSNKTRGVMFWILGSLASSSWTDVGLAALVVGIGLIVILGNAHALDAFTFGADHAATLGVNVRRVRIALITVTALLTATVVSQSGGIGFVGLVLPHVGRLLCGVAHRALLPTASLTGAIFLVWADTLGRTVAAPVEIPVGVITALIGVPVFAALMMRHRNLS